MIYKSWFKMDVIFSSFNKFRLYLIKIKLKQTIECDKSVGKLVAKK